MKIFISPALVICIFILANFMEMTEAEQEYGKVVWHST